jgi:8-oxo-dGTP pyrophosphatase MutT (NUDIX family)
VSPRQQVQVFPFRLFGGRREYLLLRRVPAVGGFWQPVTGGVEAGETPAEAAVREIGEETALAGRLLETGLGSGFTWAGIRWQETVFAWQVDAGDPVIGPEHDDFTWCGLGEAWWRLYWPLNRRHLAAIDRQLAEL